MPRLTYAVLVLGLVAAIPAGVASQDREALRRLVDSLSAQIVTTRSALRTAYRGATAADSIPDSLPLGGALAFTDPSRRGHVARAVEIAGLELERRLGRRDARLLDGWRVGVGAGYWGSRWRDVPLDGWMRYNPEEQPRRTAERLVGTAMARLASLAGTRLLTWSNWTAALRTAQLDGYYRAAYFDLVTSPSRATRFCLRGELDWCARAAGLVEVDDPWRELATAEDRRLLIARWMAGYFLDRPDVYHQCVQDGVDAACLRLAADLAFPRLVSAPAAAALVRVATDIGGDGALTRLVANASEPLVEQLEAAAQTPIDTVVAAWRIAALDASPPPTAAASITLWVSLFVVAALIFASTRSSRWRLG